MENNVNDPNDPFGYGPKIIVPKPEFPRTPRDPREEKTVLNFRIPERQKQLKTPQAVIAGTVAVLALAVGSGIFLTSRSKPLGENPTEKTATAIVPVTVYPIPTDVVPSTTIEPIQMPAPTAEPSEKIPNQAEKPPAPTPSDSTIETQPSTLTSSKKWGFPPKTDPLHKADGIIREVPF